MLNRKDVRQSTLFEWQSISKSLGEFHLKAASGTIRVNEIIGICGMNGIGKSTFLNELSRLNDLKVSVKPQDLTRNEQEVKDFLSSSKSDAALLDLVQEFKDKKLSQLSGGELQKVYLVKALSAEADLYLLDEPTAWLDVEERLKIARLIQQLIINKARAAFVVDHDLLFLSYVANRLIIAQGVPGIKGLLTEPLEFKQGLNQLLKTLNITLRKDPETGRLRVNKPGSQLDAEQKKIGCWVDLS